MGGPAILMMVWMFWMEEAPTRGMVVLIVQIRHTPAIPTPSNASASGVHPVQARVAALPGIIHESVEAHNTLYEQQEASSAVYPFPRFCGFVAPQCWLSPERQH